MWHRAISLGIGMGHTGQYRLKLCLYLSFLYMHFKGRNLNRFQVMTPWGGDGPCGQNWLHSCMCLFMPNKCIYGYMVWSQPFSCYDLGAISLGLGMGPKGNTDCLKSVHIVTECGSKPFSCYDPGLSPWEFGDRPHRQYWLQSCIPLFMSNKCILYGYRDGILTVFFKVITTRLCT